MVNVYGALAQLVERLVRNEKVSGSTPLSSTIPFLTFWTIYRAEWVSIYKKLLSTEVDSKSI